MISHEIRSRKRTLARGETQICASRPLFPMSVGQSANAGSSPRHFLRLRIGRIDLFGNHFDTYESEPVTTVQQDIYRGS